MMQSFPEKHIKTKHAVRFSLPDNTKGKIYKTIERIRVLVTHTHTLVF